MANRKFSPKPKKIIVTALILLLGAGIFFGVRYLLQHKKAKVKLPSSALVSSQGAKIGKNEITVNILPESLPEGTKIEVKKAPEKLPLEANKEYASAVYEIEADQALKGPTIIEIDFDPKKFPADSKAGNLYAAYWDNDQWVAADGFLDLQRHKAVVQTDHLSFWGVLYDQLSPIWEDRIEPVHWLDVPADLKSEISEDLELNQEDIVAIEHAQFSSLTKLATFTIGIANQMVEVSSILGGIDSEKELGVALVEKVTEDAASSQGTYGELAVDVYEAGKTGYAVGTVIGHMALKTGLATAQLQSAAPQILSWILEKEMDYINRNTSQLFEYLSLYDSGSGERINTYIFFYDKAVPDRLRTKGVVLYYWAPSYKRWQKGKDVATISDVLVNVLESKTQEQSQKSGQPAATKTTGYSFAKEALPNSLIGYKLGQVNQDSPNPCYEDEGIKPETSMQAIYGEVGAVPYISVIIDKFSSSSQAENTMNTCIEWEKRIGAGSSLVKQPDLLGLPYWNTYLFGGAGGSVVGSATTIIENHLLGITIEKTSGKGSASEYQAAMTELIEALRQ